MSYNDWIASEDLAAQLARAAIALGKFNEALEVAYQAGALNSTRDLIDAVRANRTPQVQS